MKIFGPSDKRASLEPLLIWATPGQRGFPSRQTATSTSVVPASVGRIPSATVGPSRQRNQTPAQIATQREAAQKQQEALQKAAELRQVLSNLEKVDDEERRSSLLDTLFSTDDVLSLPLHPNPPSLETGELTVNLMRHQASSALQKPHFYVNHPHSCKPCSGASSAKTRFYPRRRGISLSSSGS